MKLRARVYHEPWGPDGWVGEPWLFDIRDDDAPITRLDGAPSLIDWGYAGTWREAFDEACRSLRVLDQMARTE